MSRWKLRTAIRVLLALALLPSGCGSEGSGGDAGNPVIELPAAGGNGTRADPPPPRAGSGDDGTPPLFEGGSSLVAFDGGVLLRWQPASDGRSPTAALRYRVYTSPEDGEQDFSRPSFETEPGEASIIIPGQEGERLFVVVRAVDEAGNEDSNETQWQGTPFPVLLVDPSAEEGGDGLSVETALRSLDDAIGIALGFEGVNIFMVAGEYQESVLLFEGMMVYGGFAPGFQIEARDPEKHRTILFAGPEEDIIVLPPGETPCGLDGITLDGRGQARRGVVADDCSIHIAHCTVQAFQEKGIELRSEYDSGSDSMLHGIISHCTISGNSGEGIHLEGPTDITLRSCHLAGNEEEGIDIDPLVVLENSKSQVEIENCTVEGNQDIGVRIRISELEKDPGSGGRLRLNLRGNHIVGNADHGISIDIRYPPDRGTDLRVRLEYNSLFDNQKSGIHVDGDAPGDFQLLGNLAQGNRGEAGLELTGDCPAAFFRIQNCALLGNSGDGVHLSGNGSIWIDQCEIVANGRAGVETDGQWSRLSSTLLRGNGRPASPSRLDYSLIVGEGQIQPPIPATSSSSIVSAFDGSLDGPLHGDLGDPLVLDQDGSRADIGVGGGFHGAPAGSTGDLQDKRRALEIIAIDPPPGDRARNGTWKLRFNGTVDEAIGVRLKVDGVLREDLVVEATGRVLEVRTTSPIEEGSKILLEFLPWTSPRPEIRSHHGHPVFDFIGLSSPESVTRC